MLETARTGRLQVHSRFDRHFCRSRVIRPRKVKKLMQLAGDRISASLPIFLGLTMGPSRFANPIFRIGNSTTLPLPW